jgi:hypothetical protein
MCMLQLHFPKEFKERPTVGERITKQHYALAGIDKIAPWNGKPSGNSHKLYCNVTTLIGESIKELTGTHTLHLDVRVVQ